MSPGVFSKILLLSLFAAATIDGAAQTKVPKDAPERLKQAAEAAMDAFARNQYEKFADLVDPVTVRKVGGKTKIVEMMKQVSADSLKTFRTYRVVGGEPEPIVDAGTHLLSIVPMRIEGTTPKDHVVVAEDCTRISRSPVIAARFLEDVVSQGVGIHFLDA